MRRAYRLDIFKKVNVPAAGYMTGMVTERDFRKFAAAQRQAELRRIAVAMVRAGKTRDEVAATVGVNRPVCRSLGQDSGAARRGGLGGRAAGPWSGRAESTERGTRRGTALPDRPGVPLVGLALSFALWTRQAVRALIASGVWLSLSVVSDACAAGASPRNGRCAGPPSGGGGSGMAGEHLSGDCPQGPGAGGNPLGRRGPGLWGPEPIRPQLCPQRAYPGHPATAAPFSQSMISA